MASTTHTFSQFQVAIPQNHTGLNINGGSTQTAPASASTVLNICQVPNGATLVDYYLAVATGGDDNTVELGTSNTPSGIMLITTLTSTYSISVGTNEEINIINKNLRAPSGTTGVVNQLLPIRISLSDDAQPSTVWIQGRMGAAHSASAYFTAVFYYTCDGMAGRTTIR